jgi:hypothetical protein
MEQAVSDSAVYGTVTIFVDFVFHSYDHAACLALHVQAAIGAVGE